MGVMGNLCKATAPAKKPAALPPSEAGSGPVRRLSEDGSGSPPGYPPGEDPWVEIPEEGEEGSGSGPVPRSAEAIQFEMLRAQISGLGDATLKGNP